MKTYILTTALTVVACAAHAQSTKPGIPYNPEPSAVLGETPKAPGPKVQEPTVVKEHTGWVEALGSPELFLKTRARVLRLKRAELARIMHQTHAQAA